MWFLAEPENFARVSVLFLNGFLKTYSMLFEYNKTGSKSIVKYVISRTWKNLFTTLREAFSTKTILWYIRLEKVSVWAEMGNRLMTLRFSVFTMIKKTCLLAFFAAWALNVNRRTKMNENIEGSSSTTMFRDFLRMSSNKEKF